MALYAQDAMETDKPWERWQVQTAKHWHDMRGNPEWIAELDYRRKPLTSRDRFEDWARDERLDMSVIYTDEYFSDTTTIAWEAWQEAERQAGLIHIEVASRKQRS
jgi:hypothetical protein